MKWQEKKLGDVLTLKRGYDLPNSQREEGNVPVVSSAGITGFHNVPKIKAPGVVTGRYGTLGEVYFIDVDFWPLNTSLYIQDFKENNPRFIAYFLQYCLRGTGSDKAAVPGVNRNDLHAREVLFPNNIATQQKIADILSKYDDLIENNRRRIELLEESARLLYREWFVYLRFPGHEHTPIIDGIPEGWEKGTVSSVCLEFIDGDWIETKDQGGEDYRLLQISNIGNNEFIETNNFRYITEDTFRNLRCNGIVTGDILISRMPKPIGRAWMVTPMKWRMITAVDVTIARPNPAIVDKFYYLYHLNSSEHIARCEAYATGTTRPRISRKNMATLPILIPPINLQKEFGNFAKKNHEIKINLQGQNNLLQQARDILLPRLMNGEIAV